jgi:hypothetical protein
MAAGQFGRTIWPPAGGAKAGKTDKTSKLVTRSGENYKIPVGVGDKQNNNTKRGEKRPWIKRAN